MMARGIARAPSKRHCARAACRGESVGEKEHQAGGKRVPVLPHWTNPAGFSLEIVALREKSQRQQPGMAASCQHRRM
jgi:hypothetical protein